jgi:hypothetical protein
MTHTSPRKDIPVSAGLDAATNGLCECGCGHAIYCIVEEKTWRHVR